MIGRLRERVEGWAPRRRFYAACMVGGILATAVFAWFAFEGRAEPFAREFQADVYEIQARSLLDGHWDVPADALSFERFAVDGKYYTYFGPWPAILRLPVVAITDDLDGQLSRVSMLLAFAVMLVFVSRLSWQARTMLRGDGPPTRMAAVGAAAFVFVAGCGSAAIFLAGFTWVYHEAVLWGIAWAVASFSFFISYLRDERGRDLALASATAALAYLSRGTVGAGPVAALGILLVARLGRWALETWRRRRAAESTASENPPWLRWLGLGGGAENRSIWPLLAATATPLVLYAYVNAAKFGTLFGPPPYDKQDILLLRETRRAALADGGGNLFGIKYAPTNLLQYFRPDAIRFDRLFPWVTFSRPPRVFGGAVFDELDFSASITASSTLLFVLAVVGCVVLLRSGTAAVFRVPVVAAGIACIGTVVIAFLAERYLGDFVPLLVVAGVVGLWSVPAVLERRGRAARVSILTVLVVLGVWSCWAMGSLTLLHQRAYGQNVQAADRAGLIDFQLSVHEGIPGGAPSRVGHVAALPLPAPASAASFVVLGDCDGFYWTSGEAWYAVEQTRRSGRFDLRVRFDRQPVGTRVPLLAASDATGTGVVWARYRREGRIAFDYEWSGAPSAKPVTTDAIRVVPGRVVDLEVQLDPVLGFFEVRADGRVLGTAFVTVPPGTVVIGRQDLSTDDPEEFAGTIRAVPTPTPVCRRLVDLEGGK